MVRVVTSESDETEQPPGNFLGFQVRYCASPLTPNALSPLQKSLLY